MDSSQNRGERKQCLPCLLLLLTILSQTDTIPEGTWRVHNNSSQSACLENEYENDDGVCCDKCPPGFKLTKKCAGVSLRSQCEKCSNGTFQDKTNYFENCFRCSKCKTKNSYEIAACTHLKDVECVCKDGYYKKEINRDTWSCAACKKCGDGERKGKECGGKQDTECLCKDLHYRVNSKTCAFCTNCSSQCAHLCQVSTKTSISPTTPTIVTAPHKLFILALVVSMALTLAVIGYEVVRKLRKRRTAQTSSSSSQPPDPETSIADPTLTYPDPSFEVDDSPLLKCPCVTTVQDPVLPDCVPREIKRHDFIYFVLDVVPISRFKELARRLNVSEQDIERAERDNRAFIDAQYQMLKVWSDGGHGGGSSVLAQSLVHECVSTLKDMNLNSSAESIEQKYCAEVQTFTARASTDTQTCT
ncbi:tumor necrosis factor receptor superfamily member 1A [Brachyhypopomus gauderio]|uniref:tumor necrosis factor receptor superfamily member 1A n=1 Tax=Brachyhypopomus gauderio TaxID=698409 RepID=UPI0040416A95